MAQVPCIVVAIDRDHVLGIGTNEETAAQDACERFREVRRGKLRFERVTVAECKRIAAHRGAVPWPLPPASELVS